MGKRASAARLAPAPQEALRLAGQLAHNVRGGLDPLDPADGLPGPQRHRVNRARVALVDGVRPETHNRIALARVIVPPLPDDLSLEGLE